MLKSITAKELFRKFSSIKAKLWGGKFWTSGFYVNTVIYFLNKLNQVFAYLQKESN